MRTQGRVLVLAAVLAITATLVAASYLRSAGDTVEAGLTPCFIDLEGDSNCLVPFTVVVPSPTATPLPAESTPTPPPETSPRQAALSNVRDKLCARFGEEHQACMTLRQLAP
jgi:hypothetical protein